MIDLRGYLRKLNQPSTGWAAPGERYREADAVLVRARLGNYQRALTSARKVLRKSHPAAAFHPVGTSLFITNSDGGADRGSSARKGADQ